MNQIFYVYLKESNTCYAEVMESQWLKAIIINFCLKTEFGY